MFCDTENRKMQKKTVRRYYKLPQKLKKIKGRPIICRHIKHIDMPKYVLKLYTQAVKVCKRYMPAKTNAVN